MDEISLRIGRITSVPYPAGCSEELSFSGTESGWPARAMAAPSRGDPYYRRTFAIQVPQSQSLSYKHTTKKEYESRRESFNFNILKKKCKTKTKTKNSQIYLKKKFLWDHVKDQNIFANLFSSFFATLSEPKYFRKLIFSRRDFVAIHFIGY